MGSRFGARRSSRLSQRFARRRHQIEERQARIERNAEPIEPHVPEHPYGCLRCFMVRQEQRRDGGQAAER